MYLLRRCLIGASLALAVAVAQGQTSYSFTTSGSTGVTAQGVLSFYNDGRIEINVTNTSAIDSAITGIFIHQPEVGGGLVELVPEVPGPQYSIIPASFELVYELTLEAEQVNNLLVNASDKTDYDGVALSPAGNPENDGLQKGVGATTTFFYDASFAGLDISDLYPAELENPILIFRWNAVYDETQDARENSDKTIADIVYIPIVIVPEPSTIGLMAAGSLIGLIALRRSLRRRRSKNAA